MKKYLNKQLIALSIIILILSCGNKKNVESEQYNDFKIEKLKSQNDSLDSIIYKLYNTEWENINWKTEICTLNINKCHDDFEIQISFILNTLPENIFEKIIENLYGIYEKDEMIVLVYSDYAELLFEKIDERLNLFDFVFFESIEEYVPPTFDPDQFVYKFKDNKIIFLRHEFI